ncbi:MAG: efflux RND transporter permease subunit [Spirochaetia bacterium]
MMNLIFTRRRGILFLFVLLAAAGAFLVQRLPVKLYPNTRKPMVAVFISHPGYTAEDFHDRYSRTIEERLSGIRDADRIEAEYGNGRTRFIIEFDWEMDGEEARTRVDNAMSAIDSSLPEESRDYRIFHWSSENMGFLAASITSDEIGTKALYDLVEPVLRPRLSGIEDAESVEIVNVEELNASITLKPLALLGYGLTANQAAQAVRSSYKPVPVGSFQVDREQYNVRIKHGIESIFDIENIVVDTRENQKILLKDIADVTVEYDLPSQLFRSNGSRAVLVFATPRSGGNIRQMSEDVKTAMEDARSNLPEHVRFDFLVDPAVFINRAIRNVVRAALLGAFLAVCIIIILLGELKNTLIIALSIPLSMVFSFILMHLFDVSLNLISLGGMTLSVGMIIDSSIVVMENIHRHRKEVQESGKKAALKEVISESVVEVRGAVIAATLTSIFVFLPLSFTAPLTNALLGDLAKTVIFALSCSLVTALVIIPIIAYYLFQRRKSPDTLFRESRLSRISDGFMAGISRGYVFLLRRLLRSRAASAVFILFSFALLAGGVIFVTPRIRQEIIAEPKSDKIVLGYMKYDSESKEELLEAVAPIEEDLLTNYPDTIESVFAEITSERRGSFIIALTSSRATDEMQEILNEKYQSSTAWRYFIMPWDPSRLPLPRILDLQIKITGPDKHEILNLMERVSDLIRGEDLYRNVYTDPSTGTSEEIVLYPRLEVMEGFPEYGVSSLASIGRTALHGSSVIEMNEGGELVSVTMSFPEGSIRSEEDLQYFLVPSRGRAVPLKHFFTVKRERGVRNITTLDGQENFNIYAQMNFDTPAHLREEYENRIRELLDENLEIPSGYAMSFENTQELIDDSIRSLLVALGASVLLIFLILAIQFNSLRIPLVVLVTVPLGFIGVIASLFIFDSTISLNSMLGMILLGGIVVNNAILMIDFYFQSLSRFPDKLEAILYAARLRLPPIIITMMTTVLGMLPIALALGDGTNIIQPLGIAVSGGLVVSTLFTLFIVPTILNSMDVRGNARELYPALFAKIRSTS